MISQTDDGQFYAFMQGTTGETFDTRDLAERWLVGEWTKAAHQARRDTLMLSALLARRDELDENECPDDLDDELVEMSHRIRDNLWTVLANHPAFVLLADAERDAGRDVVQVDGEDVQIDADTMHALARARLADGMQAFYQRRDERKRETMTPERAAALAKTLRDQAAALEAQAGVNDNAKPVKAGKARRRG